ncbi:MAG: hypothetical protein FD145_434 [Candidatus Saganbacteria bacterium]|uniref:Uncharacterized protein n=1 Tax=Candidatus Saganbacteria bacterium TaxID=2575572 RepID=A0A833P3F9_UNCSA|nr:MAG: hypothetical protein FD145_434 [Candidatus Saganbacteria bacterium]
MASNIGVYHVFDHWNWNRTAKNVNEDKCQIKNSTQKQVEEGVKILKAANGNVDHPKKAVGWIRETFKHWAWSSHSIYTPKGYCKQLENATKQVVLPITTTPTSTDLNKTFNIRQGTSVKIRINSFKSCAGARVKIVSNGRGSTFGKITKSKNGQSLTIIVTVTGNAATGLKKAQINGCDGKVYEFGINVTSRFVRKTGAGGGQKIVPPTKKVAPAIPAPPAKRVIPE